MMFKYYHVEKRLLEMHPLILMIMFDCKNYCDENGLSFLVTEGLTTEEEDKKVRRMHKTHRTGRSFDLSVKGWKDREISLFIDHYNRKYSHIAAISSLSNKPTLIIDHIGTARHLHFQIHAKYSLNYKSLPLE